MSENPFQIYNFFYIATLKYQTFDIHLHEKHANDYVFIFESILRLASNDFKFCSFIFRTIKCVIILGNLNYEYSSLYWYFFF